MKYHEMWKSIFSTDLFSFNIVIYLFFNKSSVATDKFLKYIFSPNKV